MRIPRLIHGTLSPLPSHPNPWHIHKACSPGIIIYNVRYSYKIKYYAYFWCFISTNMPNVYKNENHILVSLEKHHGYCPIPPHPIPWYSHGNPAHMGILFLWIIPQIRLLHVCCTVFRARGFHGRKTLLQSVKQYVRSNSRYPLLVCGDSGTGKTALLAMAAKTTKKWINE